MDSMNNSTPEQYKKAADLLYAIAEYGLPKDSEKYGDMVLIIGEEPCIGYYEHDWDNTDIDTELKVILKNGKPILVRYCNKCKQTKEFNIEAWWKYEKYGYEYFICIDCHIEAKERQKNGIKKHIKKMKEKIVLMERVL